MKKESLDFLVVAHVLSWILQSTVIAEPHKGASDSSAKKEISEEEAQKIALKIVSGTVLEVEHEKYRGVQVYSVEIRGKDGVHEIVINAATGNVIEDRTKGTHDDDDDEDGNDS